MQPVYVSDSNIWIDFRNAGLLDELFQLPFIYISTDIVLAELLDLTHDELTRRGLRIVSLDGEALSSLVRLAEEHNNSSLADVSCYLLARETRQPLLTGDGRLRKQALKDGLHVHGALWLLDQLLTHELASCDRLSVALEAMLAAGARLPSADCHHRLAEWKK